MGYLSKSLRFQTKELDSWRQTVVSPYTVLVRPHLVHSIVGDSTTKGRHWQSPGTQMAMLPFPTLTRFLLFLRELFKFLHLILVPTPRINSQKMTWPQRYPQTTQVHILFPQVHPGVEEVFFPLLNTFSSTACHLFCLLRKLLLLFIYTAFYIFSSPFLQVLSLGHKKEVECLWSLNKPEPAFHPLSFYIISLPLLQLLEREPQDIIFLACSLATPQSPAF